MRLLRWQGLLELKECNINNKKKERYTLLFSRIEEKGIIPFIQLNSRFYFPLVPVVDLGLLQAEPDVKVFVFVDQSSL